jgi:choline dehydrogenase
LPGNFTVDPPLARPTQHNHHEQQQKENGGMKRNDSGVSASPEEAIDTLECALLAGRIDRRQFLKFAIAAGASAASASSIAAKAIDVRENQWRNARSLKRSYDYIVCGAGSSGCVVAARLAANPAVNVLLLEAGGTDDAPSITNPSVWFTNIGAPTDWQYTSEPVPTLNGRTIAMPMGRAIGGGSSINAMIFARGHKNDYDGWAREADDSAWSYDHVLSIYKRIENWQGAPDPAYRGVGGPVWVEPLQNPNPLAPAMVKAAAALGIPSFDDMNGAMMEGPGGCAMPNVTIKDGHRRNVASHYLYPLMDRPNLTVLTRAFVQRVTLEGTRATGIEFVWRGTTHKISAAREVILSMGGINTPKVLMLSGIGARQVLSKAGVPVRHELAGVGRNFQDHPLVSGCVWEYKTPIPLRNNAAECTLFWKSNAALPTPDMQPFLIEVPLVSPKIRELYAIPQAGFTIGPGLVKPKSRGYVEIVSANPQDKPLIQPNLLSHPDDIESLLRCVELVREIGNSKEMSEFVKAEVTPKRLGRADMIEFLRNASTSYFHETCTCKMGIDEMSVVDSKLRVHGIDKLRIADGSIMPVITTGNTMAPCIVIGERMAEILDT